MGVDLLVRPASMIIFSRPCLYGLIRSCEVPLQELASTKEFAVRACDGHMQVQPEHMTWSVYIWNL